MALEYDSHAGLCPRCLIRVGIALQPAERLKAERSSSAADAAEELPRRFGDYELIERIARGGMGVVYRARQVSLNRIVALKMILAGELATRPMVLRFRLEAEAAANLRHPNIVAIYETGEVDGQHYFSMEYVGGADLGRLAAKGPLPAQRAARYLEKIAQAVEYAHQHGVLHRDLKPSNVLIDADDEPRVTDFGLAKRLVVPPSGGPADDVLDPTGPAEAGTTYDLTMSGQLLGSPNFMPPEQASAKRGKVGRHSDVYGLGALLYHLLTGRPPFQAATLEETLQQVFEREPVSPSALNPSVPRDLETICLKCLEKETSRRYATAQAVADELGRFLRGEPILARQVNAPERLWRWCRRKPVIASLGASTALAVAGGLALALAGFAAARQESRTALRSAQKSQRVAELLRELIATVEPASGKGRDFTVRAMLDAFSADLEQRLANDPEVEASVRTALASAYLELYETDTAWTHLSRALALVEKHLPEDSLESAIVFQTVGEYYSVNERNTEAWPYFRKADRVLRRELPPDHFFRLLQLKAQLATCHRDAGDFPPAYQLLTEAVALTRRKAGEREADLWRANALRFLAGMYRVERRFAEARETVAEWRQALAPHQAASHQLLLLADFQEALLFRGQAQLSGDAQLFEQAIAGFTHVLEVQSKALPEEHIDTLDTRLELARTHFYAGHINDAVRLILDAYQAAHRKVGPDHEFTRRVLAALEQIRHATGLPELDIVPQTKPETRAP